MTRNPLKIIIYCLFLILSSIYLIAESMFADLLVKNLQEIGQEELTRSALIVCTNIVNAFIAAVIIFIILVRIVMLFKDMTLSELPKLFMLICLFLVVSVLIAIIVKYSYAIKYSNLNIEYYFEANYPISPDYFKLYILVNVVSGAFIAICALAILCVLKFTFDVSRIDFSSFEDDLIDYIQQLKEDHKDSKVARLERELNNLKRDL